MEVAGLRSTFHLALQGVKLSPTFVKLSHELICAIENGIRSRSGVLAVATVSGCG